MLGKVLDPVGITVKDIFPFFFLKKETQSVVVETGKKKKNRIQCDVCHNK